MGKKSALCQRVTLICGANQWCSQERNADVQVQTVCKQGVAFHMYRVPRLASFHLSEISHFFF